MCGSEPGNVTVSPATLDVIVVDHHLVPEQPLPALDERLRYRVLSFVRNVLDADRMRRLGYRYLAVAG